MKLFKRFNTVFYKLVTSYITLVISITLLLGSISYLYFSSTYNEELRVVHHKMLEQVSNTLNNEVFEMLMSTYINITTDFNNKMDVLFLFDDPLQGNHAKIKNTYNYLQNIIVTNSDIISAIHIYYKQHNLIISSSLGIKYLNEKNRETLNAIDWLKMMKSSKKNILWLDTRTQPNNLESGKSTTTSNLITFVRAYPWIKKGLDSQGLIAIDVKEHVLSNIIEKTIPFEYANTFIVNSKGEIISHSNKDKLYDTITQDNDMSSILTSDKHSNSFIGEVANVPSLISFTTLPNSDWKLVNITEQTKIYQKTSKIKQRLLYFCLIALVIGIALATVFTSHIYNPLEDIIKYVRSLIGSSPSIPNKENEYAFINGVINELSVKVNKLESTLQNSKPVIKHNLVMGLLHHQILSKEELLEKTKLLNIPLTFSNYLAIIIDLNDKAFRSLTVENSHFVKYNLIQQFEKNNNSNTLVMGVDLPDSQIGIIVGSNTSDIKSLCKNCSLLASYAYANFMINAGIAIGGWEDSILNVNRSFKNANTLLKYRYFLPKKRIFTNSELLSREECSQLIPDNIIDKFSEALHLRNIKQVTDILKSFVTLCVSKQYSANHCHQKILRIVNVFSRYLQDINYAPSETHKKYLDNIFYEITDIYEFKNWLIQFAEQVFHYLEKQSDSRNTEIIEMAKKFISEHLDKDLSLDTVAEHVSINARYLSKMFKEETGINYTSFVTDLRIESAKKLLISTSMTVQEVGYKVGFNTPAYFIRQFKAKYGYTPNDYRRNFIR